jgi:hypothetical protein
VLYNAPGTIRALLSEPLLDEELFLIARRQ